MESSSVQPCALCSAPLQAIDQRCPACEGLAVVQGRYRLQHELGRGGTGVVYAAERGDGGLPVVVKVMSLHGARDWKVHELFERGSVALLDLDHPNIPRGLAFEQDARGRLYQVRERLDGGTLQQRIEAGRGMTPAELRQLIRALLRTLEYLHMRTPPLIHRDIKPANVMFRDAESWEPLLVDFETVSVGLSATGTTIVASAGYTAPEQLAGHAVPASDLYSVGALVLYALTRRHPATLPQASGRHDLGALAGRYDARLLRVLKRLLEPSLTERFSSAAEALEALEAPLGTLAHVEHADRRALARRGALERLGKRALLPALGLIAFSFWAAGFELDRRTAAFLAELSERSPTIVYYDRGEASFEVLEALAYKHRLLLSDVSSEVRVIRGETPLAIVDELKRFGVYDPDGAHSFVDEGMRGDTYITLRARVSSDAWLWSRERDLEHTFMTRRALQATRREPAKK